MNNQTIYTVEEQARIQQQHNEILQIRNSQSSLLKEYCQKFQIQYLKQKQRMDEFFSTLQNYLNVFQQSLKKAKEKKWVCIIINGNSLKYYFHSDLLIYKVYKKHQDQPKQIKQNIVQEQVPETLLLEKINPNLLNLQNPENKNKFNSTKFEEMIENIYNAENYLFKPDQFVEYVENLRSEYQNKIEEYWKNQITFIKEIYGDFSAYSQETQSQNNSCLLALHEYKNFADKKLNIDDDLKQIKLTKFSNFNDIKNNSIYVMRCSKAIVFLDNRKKQKIAYVFNKFSYYDQVTQVIDQLKQQKIDVVYFRAVKLEETSAFLVANYIWKYKLKKNSSEGIIQEYFHKDQQTEIEKFYKNKIQNKQQLNQYIDTFVQKYQANMNHKIFLQDSFIQELQNRFKKSQIQIPLFEVKDYKNYKQTKDQIGTILTGKNLLCGVVINLNNLVVLFSPEFQNQSNQQFSFILTKVKNINVKAAQFYVSLIVHFQIEPICKNIKRFLELKITIAEPLKKLFDIIDQQQIDAALIKLATLLKDEPVKKEKPKPTRPIYINQDDSSVSEITSQPSNFKQSKMSTKQINQFVERMNEKYSQTQNKILMMRQERTISPIQVMNEKSKSILKQKTENSEYQSLFERAKLRQLQKEELIRQNEKLKIQEELMSIKTKQSTAKSVDRFLEKMDYWQIKKTQNIQSQQQEKLERELEGVTFKPNLNPVSHKITQEQYKDSDIFERFQRQNQNKQMNDYKLLQRELKKTPFSPTINKKSVQINAQVQKNTRNRNHNYYQKSNTLAQENDFKQKSNITKNFQKEHQKNSKSLTPDKFQSKYQTEKREMNDFQKNRNLTPLRANKAYSNVQEVKYNPNLKFFMTLTQKEQNYSSLF